jgi:hypothetical protein
MSEARFHSLNVFEISFVLRWPVHLWYDHFDISKITIFRICLSNSIAALSKTYVVAGQVRCTNSSYINPLLNPNSYSILTPFSILI